MIDKQLLTTSTLAAAWEGSSKSTIRAASKTLPPGGTRRDTGSVPTK